MLGAWEEEGIVRSDVARSREPSAQESLYRSLETSVLRHFAGKSGLKRTPPNEPCIQTSHLPPPILPLSFGRVPVRVLRVKEHHQQPADVARTGDDEGVGSSREEGQVADELASRGDAGGERESVEGGFVLVLRKRSEEEESGSRNQVDRTSKADEGGGD